MGYNINIMNDDLKNFVFLAVAVVYGTRDGTVVVIIPPLGSRVKYFDILGI